MSRTSISRLQTWLWTLVFLNSAITFHLCKINAIFDQQHPAALWLQPLTEKTRTNGTSVRNAEWSSPSSQQQQQQQQQVEEQRGDGNEAHYHHHHHQVAGLTCESFSGGPNSSQAIAEMIYWRDIPSDSSYQSPFYDDETTTGGGGEERFLTFEPDEAGFNNVRMSMEVAVAMAIAMGRTLVLPPKFRMYMMPDKTPKGFDDYFHFDSVNQEFLNARGGFKYITFEEFLERVVMTGQLRDQQTGQAIFPPYNRTNWDGYGSNFVTGQGVGKVLWGWMRDAVPTLSTSPFDCLVVFPEKDNDDGAIDRMASYLDSVFQHDRLLFGGTVEERKFWQKRRESFMGNPVAVDSSVLERMREVLADRTELCVYSMEMKKEKFLHVKGEEDTGHRLLAPFYTFLFFENWQQDLWMKRFVRDHLRFKDEIQCAAARIVHELREEARARGNPSGEFHSLHIRRGDFQENYEATQISCSDIYKRNTRHFIPEFSTVYIATDERNLDYFRPLRRHYNIKFFSDYMHLVSDVNPNYYGLIEQLVAARGETFGGVYYSTFSAYINRIRGYHSQKNKYDGHEIGALKSYYVVSDELSRYRHIMQNYSVVTPSYWKQEFPLGWRDIDHDVLDHSEIVS